MDYMCGIKLYSLNKKYIDFVQETRFSKVSPVHVSKKLTAFSRVTKLLSESLHLINSDFKKTIEY